MADERKEKSRVRLIALWMVLIGFGIGLIIYFAVGPVATFVSSLGEDNVETDQINLDVYRDADINNQRDSLSASEHGVGFVTVNFDGPTQRSVVTNSAGAASLNLPIGMYSVEVKYDGVILESTVNELTVVSNQDLEVQIPITTDTPIADVFGLVHIDKDSNGILDDLDPPLPELAVNLEQDGRLLARTVTNQNGLYRFPAREPGSYSVRVSPTAEQQNIFNLEGELVQTIIVRSEQDPKYIDFLFEEQVAPVTSQSQYRLAQAGLLMDITKLASDNDEKKVEFVHTQPGQTLSFDLSLVLGGDAQATFPDLKIVDVYPSFLAVSSITGGGTDDGSKITWDIGDKAGGQTLTFSYQAQVAASLADVQADNLATASATDIPDDEDDTTIIVKNKPLQVFNNVTNTTNTTNTATGGTTNTTGRSTGGGTANFGVNASLIAGLVVLPVALIAGVLFVGARRSSRIT